MKSAAGAGIGGMSGVPSYAFPAKRRWKGLVIGVLVLVILSMLVPLVFLLGLHNGFHYAGYISEQQSSPSNQNVLEGYGRYNVRDTQNQSQGERATHVHELMQRFEPTIPKDVLKNYAHEANNETIRKGSKKDDQERGFKMLPDPFVQSQSHPSSNNSRGSHVENSNDEGGKSCELTFGSYCLWRQVHREGMKDIMVKRLKDQLFVARAYYPSIAKLPAQDKLCRQMKQNIQELEHVLSESTTDADLPPQIVKKLQNMEDTITTAKSFPVDCNNVDKKLRQILDLAEDEADFHMKQSAFLYKLTVQTMPKSLHCLSLKLTVEYFKSPPLEKEAMSEKLADPSLHHYVIFSNNVLAASVVINSTVLHAKESQNQVFHVLTDGQNYYAMKLWFSRNNYKETVVEVLNIEHLDVNINNLATPLRLSLPEEFRVSFHNISNPSMSAIRTEYFSVFSHSHYLLPDIFSNLKKIVVLDDDVVVQQDLSALWSLSMSGKVNGAVQFCSVRLGQLKSYLGEKGFRQNSCVWMSGLNIIDLVRWRELGLSQTYRRLIKELSIPGESISDAAWRASLLTFEDKICPLDNLWVTSGLGHNYVIDCQAIKRAAVLHYNGNMKPWLDLGIPNSSRYGDGKQYVDAYALATVDFPSVVLEGVLC
ncbi:hypothetical protein L6164_000002 [Bauhinia variegata]|uniref:Uncharacterized protein n=1 Tax=Bauhinia variegata TaxID=167791 RepID=A0ACB9Q555_BAUVA|nr:hypothetical protein L6164_000002 [Bauhinia variegata]